MPFLPRRRSGWLCRSTARDVVSVVQPPPASPTPSRAECPAAETPTGSAGEDEGSAAVRGPVGEHAAEPDGENAEQAPAAVPAEASSPVAYALPPPLPPPPRDQDGTPVGAEQHARRGSAKLGSAWQRSSTRSRSGTPQPQDAEPASTPSVTGHNVTVNNTTHITVYHNYQVTLGSPERRADPGARYRVDKSTGCPADDLDDVDSLPARPREEPQQLGTQGTVSPPRSPRLCSVLKGKHKRGGRTNIVSGGCMQQPARAAERPSADMLLSSFGIASLRNAHPSDLQPPGVVVFEQSSQDRRCGAAAL